MKFISSGYLNANLILVKGVTLIKTPFDKLGERYSIEPSVRAHDRPFVVSPSNHERRLGINPS